MSKAHQNEAKGHFPVGTPIQVLRSVLDKCALKFVVLISLKGTSKTSQLFIMAHYQLTDQEDFVVVWRAFGKPHALKSSFPFPYNQSFW